MMRIEVTVLERGAQKLNREDPEVAGVLANCLRREGIELQVNAVVNAVSAFYPFHRS